MIGGMGVGRRVAVTVAVQEVIGMLTAKLFLADGVVRRNGYCLMDQTEQPHEILFSRV